MKQFRRLLVGVDLATPDRMVCREVYGPSAEAVRRALWLARQNGAEVCFCYSLDPSAATERLIEEHRGFTPNIFDEAAEALGDLVERADAAGVEATSKVTMGPAWHQLIREAISSEQDLVIVGTRDTSNLQRVLIGSTAMKLLRKCPTPVWVTKPQPNPSNAILVAHDLTDVGRQALDLGASMAQLTDASLHILHAVQLAEFDEKLPTGIEYDALQRKQEDARTELEAQAAQLGLSMPPQISIAVGRASDAILRAIDRHHIELVVLGTVARTGIRGLVMGNTAERLLPLLPCSVVAVKPEGFECPYDVFDD